MSDPMPDALDLPSPEPQWVDKVLAFWFGELNRADWFGSTGEVDERIAREFGDTVERLASADIETFLVDAKTALAAIIVLDQFPRNLYRGTARSFAYDAEARAIANSAVALGYDGQLGKDERLFMYLPFEHSEILCDQVRSVDLISRLGDAEYDKYAIEHRDIIARFGRFPHRNEALGRTSRPDELDFLAEGGATFGVPTSDASE